MMEDTTYLTEDKLKEMTVITKNVSDEYLTPFIETSEEMHVVPILGTALDTQLKSEIEQGSISGSNETLWVNYINPMSAWYTFYEASPFLSIKAFNKGLVKQTSDNSDSIDRDELRDYRQSILDKAVFYRNRLIDYLTENRTTYPLWRSNDGGADCSDIKKSNSTGFYIGGTKGTYKDRYYNY